MKDSRGQHVIKQFKSWSFTRWSDYEECPAKAKYKHLDKLKEPKNDAMQRGIDLHTAAENFIKGRLTDLPHDFRFFADEFKRLRSLFKRKTLAMIVEDDWAFRADWTRTTWDDWNDCYLRIKIDVGHFEDVETLVITDWKSGKYSARKNDSYEMQMELYALPALIIHPHVKRVFPRLAYTDEGLVWDGADEPLVYTPADIDRLKKLWQSRTRRMFADTQFAPRPGHYCTWCHYRRSNNGPCKF